jgi:hypothetical protein
VILSDTHRFVSEISEVREASTFTTSDAFGLFNTDWVVIPGQIALNGFTYRRKQMTLTNLHPTLDCYINSITSLTGNMLNNGFIFHGLATSAPEGDVGERALFLYHASGERVIFGSDSIRLYNPGADAAVMSILALIVWYPIA